MIFILNNEITKNFTNRRQCSHLTKDASAGRRLPITGTTPLAFCHLHSAFCLQFFLVGQKCKVNASITVLHIDMQMYAKRSECSSSHLFNIKKVSQKLERTLLHISSTPYTILSPSQHKGKIAGNGLNWSIYQSPSTTGS